MRSILAACIACGLLAGCPKYTSYVRSDETALGRIVVYRNGVAFYERRATVLGSTLTLKVPSDKVDDFLKSLTIVDASTNKPLPVSYPTFDAAAGDVDMVIQLPGKGPHELLLTYVVEAASWKPSYRIVVKDDDKVKVEAWAIVDNTSGEDWNGVKVGVGSSSALSFRYDLRSVRRVQRQTLEDEQRFAQAPPTGGSVHQDGQEKVLGVLADGDLPTEPEEEKLAMTDDMEAPMAEAAPTAAGSAAGGGRASRPSARSAPPAPAAPPRDDYQDRRQEQLARQRAAEARIRQLADSLNGRSGTIVIEGFANPGEPNAEARSLERAHALRNQLIAAGVAPGRIRPVGRGVVAGNAAGARLLEEAAPAATAQAPGAPVADGEPVSESHFESSAPVDVKRGSSAMVSVLDGDTDGEVVYVYDPNAERGNDRFAFRAVMFKNPSTWALEGGPVTFFGEGRFIGEGITEAIPPGATAVVPFALDRQILVEKTAETSDRIARLITMQRGVLTAEVKHIRTTKLRIVNRLRQPATLFVRHVSQKGWELSADGPKPYEKVGETYLFKLPLGAGETGTLELVESTPLQRTVDLRSASGLDLVRVVVESPKDWPQIVAQVRTLLDIHKEIADHEQAIVSLRERVGEYRDRLAELEGQLVSLKDVRAGGQDLMQHLRSKMMDISDRVQKATIEIVDRQQKLLLARIRFQDAVAEMTFVAPAGGAPATK